MWNHIFCGFSPNDGTVDFYTRISCFLRPEHEVLDLGAGRAAWYEDDSNEGRRNIRLLRGKAAKVTAADVDPIVLSNSAADVSVLLSKDGKLPFLDGSFDLIVADFVLEHIESPKEFSEEVSRVLKSGGLFAARTPHKFCYVALAARLINNAKHSLLLKWIQPERNEIDIFPTSYRLNTIRDVSFYFPGFENKSFIFRTDPAYYFGSNLVFKFQEFLHRIMPAIFSGNLFVFLIKN